MGIWLLVVVAQALVFGAFSSFVAKEKNRDRTGWFFLGFFFSIVALLALIGIPSLEVEREQPRRPIPSAPPLEKNADTPASRTPSDTLDVLKKQKREQQERLSNIDRMFDDKL